MNFLLQTARILGRKIIVLFILFLSFLACVDSDKGAFVPLKVFTNGNLIVTQISENSFVHTSYLQTKDFGNVPCNGLIIRSNNEAIVFDTPTNNNNSKELIVWIKNKLGCKIKAIVPTHFHEDCLGGLKAFHDDGIVSFASSKTVELAIKNDFEVPKNKFFNLVDMKFGTENVIVKYFGEGHTKDNVVAYFPKEKVLFGGCLIKEIGASKGYLGDANVDEWAGTVKDIKEHYNDVKIVVPGHGMYGNQLLLDYTIDLFKK